VLAGEPCSGAGDSRLDLIGDEDRAVVMAPALERGEEAGRRHDEPAFALNGLDDDGGDGGCPHLLLDLTDRALGGGLAVQSVAVRVGAGDPVELRGEGAEAALVGGDLGRQSHGQGGASVEGVVEADHCLAAGVLACELDGVLDGLRPGVEQRGLLREAARGQGVQAFGDLDVSGVPRDGEGGVRQVLGLLLDCSDDRRRRTAHGCHRDAGSEVDETVAVHVLQDASVRTPCECRHGGGQGAWECGTCAFVEGAGLGTGQRSGEMNGLGQRCHMDLTVCRDGRRSAAEQGAPGCRRNVLGYEFRLRLCPPLGLST